MKKYLMLVFLFIMFIPFIVNAETCVTDKISISSITVEDKSDSVEEVDEATASGKNINLNISMSEVGDHITYKVIVKNDSKDDYKLDKNSFNISSDYIDYTFESEDGTNIIKTNSSKVVYLKVNYANEVPDETFESETYNDNKTMTVTLSTGDTLKNPNTGVQAYIWIVMFILCLSGSTYIFLRKKRFIAFIIIFGILIIIPISVYALCKIDLTINSTVTVKNNYFYTSAFGLQYQYGEAIPEIPNDYLDYVSYDGYSDILSRTSMRTFLRLRLKNNKVSSSQVGFILNNKVLYLQGGINDDDLINSGMYEHNKKLIINEFNISRCEIDSSDFRSDSICTRCINNNDGRTVVLVCKNGYATAGWNSPGCMMFNGISSCYAE